MLIGCAHGRFQVFHLDHLRYISESYRRCDHLLIGITGVAPLSPTTSASDSHRSTAENNPFSYYERTRIIRAALSGEAFDLSRVTFTPFPIEVPEELQQFVPNEVHCFTTIREEWNREKVELLRHLGYTVTILYTDLNKTISGSIIRRLIRGGDSSWKQYVPTGVASYLEDNGLLVRMDIPTGNKASG